MKPDGKNIRFDDIDFANHKFDIPLGEIMSVENCELGNRIYSPDWTTDGALDKAWIRIDGVPILIKAGDFGINANGKNLLSANECIASAIASFMGIDHVKYRPLELEQTHQKVCGCESFIKNNKADFKKSFIKIHTLISWIYNI